MGKGADEEEYNYSVHNHTHKDSFCWMCTAYVWYKCYRCCCCPGCCVKHRKWANKKLDTMKERMQDEVEGGYEELRTAEEEAQRREGEEGEEGGK